MPGLKLNHVSERDPYRQSTAQEQPLVQFESIFNNCHLTHWGRLTHICVGKLTTIGSDNGLSPGRRKAIIWTNARIVLIRTLGINVSEIFSKTHTFLFKKMNLKMSCGKWLSFCLGLNVFWASTFVNAACKVSAISSRPQCVNQRFRCFMTLGENARVKIVVILLLRLKLCSSILRLIAIIITPLYKWRCPRLL